MLPLVIFGGVIALYLMANENTAGTAYSQQDSLDPYAAIGATYDVMPDNPIIIYDGVHQANIAGNKGSQTRLWDTAITDEGVVTSKSKDQTHGREVKVYFTGEPLPYEKIGSSTDVYKIVSSIIGDQMTVQEHFVALFLNKGNKIVGYYRHSIGTNDATLVDVKILVAATIKAGASNVIISHNHPSGTLRPSPADIDLTKRLKEAYLTVNTMLLDHIIVTEQGYYSFTDEGIM